MRLGIPRSLNMYEEYPFWHTLFTECGIEPVLSGASDFTEYEKTAKKVMSDNICFPAKLTHSHILDLLKKKPDRIFMPFVVFEKKGKEQNSYNCPLVSGYSQVIKSVTDTCIPIDTPAITFKEEELLYKQCIRLLEGYGIDRKTVGKAFSKALEEQGNFTESIVKVNEEILSDHDGRLKIMLAGRPYHADPLIQHEISKIISSMGIDIVTEDYVRDKDIPIDDTHFVTQWTYPDRILRAAKWCSLQGNDVQFVQLTSFGCGPDAFLIDTVQDMMARNGKFPTILKLDDINNIGSMKLRVRSLVESLSLSMEPKTKRGGFITVPVFDKAYSGRKIIAPFFTPFLSPFIPSVMKLAGYDVDNLPMSDAESAEWGLRYANNEVCYPATLIVGDIIKAFKNGKYVPEKTAVAITQTGGQCRASNYISLIKKALIDAGYKDTPVISVTFGNTVKNYQPGFRINWVKIIPYAFKAILFGDCLAKFYYATAAREKVRGTAAKLKDKYMALGIQAIEEKRFQDFDRLLEQAAAEFDTACDDRRTEKVGIVGEIYLKFNPFAQKNITERLVAAGFEVVPPLMSGFFLQNFVNTKVKNETGIIQSKIPRNIYKAVYRICTGQISKINRTASRFRYFIPFRDIFEEAAGAGKVISLNAQFGEGWLLPAEIISYYEHGVNNVISLQPFGCIANHIVVRGIEKSIKRQCPGINLLSLDFDSGVSEVNVANRLLLFLDNIN